MNGTIVNSIGLNECFICSTVFSSDSFCSAMTLSGLSLSSFIFFCKSFASPLSRLSACWSVRNLYAKVDNNVSTKLIANNEYDGENESAQPNILLKNSSSTISSTQKLLHGRMHIHHMLPCNILVHFI